MPTPVEHVSWSAEGRICKGCGQYKTKEHYSIDRGNSTGLQARCKPCRAKQVAGHRAADPDHKRKQHHYWLMSQYGVSLEWYEQQVKKQKGRCAACKELPTNSRWNTLHVDHCHDTGKVRGLLCSNCNVALGYAQNNPKRLRALAAYIETRK